MYKVWYNLRRVEQWRLNETAVESEWHHYELVSDMIMNKWRREAYLKDHNISWDPEYHYESIDNLKKYFNFVKYTFVNHTFEMEELILCNSGHVLQTVYYQREYNDGYCAETATRLRDDDPNGNLTYLSSFEVNSSDDCYFVKLLY